MWHAQEEKKRKYTCNPKSVELRVVIIAEIAYLERAMFPASNKGCLYLISWALGLRQWFIYATYYRFTNSKKSFKLTAQTYVPSRDHNHFYGIVCSFTSNASCYLFIRFKKGILVKNVSKVQDLDKMCNLMQI